MPEPRVLPADEAQKPAIAKLLLDHADRRGWVGVAVPDIAAKTGFPLHDVTHAIWDFQKQGMMKFHESKLGDRGQSLLTALRLTTNGRAAMRAMVDKPTVPEPSPVVYTPEDAIQVLADTLGEPFVPEPADYPLIATLRQRKAALEQAAGLLEQAGQDDMALAAMEKANSADLYSPLEAEAVKLWEHIARE